MSSISISILLIDDNPSDLDLIERAFKKCSHAVTIHSVSCGMDALSYLKGELIYSDRSLYPMPNFILTDLKMPQIDGFHVLEYLTNTPSLSAIRAFVLSASADSDDIHNAYMLGAASYHVKPAHYEDLCLLINVLCDYWLNCSTPLIDNSGRQFPTDSTGKLGQRFCQPTQI